MKRKFFLLATVFVFGLVQAQVGINTTDPKATLHVVPTSTDGTTAEGIIAPNLTRAQLISKDARYTGAETGASIYVTDLSGTTTAKTVNVIKEGYYYFDGALWQPHGGITAARNGLQTTSGIVELGGSLIKNTTIAQGAYELDFTGTGVINIENPVNFDGKATVNDVLYIPTGASSGKVLTSDMVGNSIWVSGATQYHTIVHTIGGDKTVAGTSESSPHKVTEFTNPVVDTAKDIYGPSYGWNNTNKSYVAPVDGVYRISYAVYLRPSGSSSKNERAYIHRNGDRFPEAGLISVTADASDMASSAMALVSLKKNDIIDLRVYTHNAATNGAPVRYYAAEGHTYIMIESL